MTEEQFHALEKWIHAVAASYFDNIGYNFHRAVNLRREACNLLVDEPILEDWIDLTEEEHQIILKKRENERFYRAGKAEAFNEIWPYLEKTIAGDMTFVEFGHKLQEMKAKL